MTSELTSIEASLESNFAGQLIGPDDPDYDQARKLCNTMIDKRPTLIARCTSAQDVQAALAHARERQLVVAVRGGGHSHQGYSSCDGGVLIDTGPMKRIEIDLERRTGRFGAGLTCGELDAATQQHGLAVTLGRVTHIGIAGLTLGSGSGWLERTYGPTCASLISAEVVTADGRIVRASETENADLLWGLKGAGGNFGIVTEFEFNLHPVGPIVFAGMILHPRAAAKELLRFYRDFMEQAPDEVGGGVALITAPPAEFVPEAARGKPACGVIVIYVGDPNHGEAELRPLLNWGKPLVKLVQPMPYQAVQQLLDPGNPWGIGDYHKIDHLPELANQAIDTVIEHAAQASSPFTDVILARLGGAISHIEERSIALCKPDTKWVYIVMAQAWNPTEQHSETAWAQAFMAAMRPWSVDKAPANGLNPDEGAARLRASYGEEKYKRLVALKDKYDPENIFSLNPNIPPSHTTP